MTEKKAAPSTDQKVEAIIELLARNGISIPEALRPKSDKK